MRRTRLFAAYTTAVTFGLIAIVMVEGACGSRTGLLGPEDFLGPSPTAEDGSADASDAFDAAAEADVRTTLPIIDGASAADVYRADCPDPSATLVYVITTDARLLSFYPPTSTFRTIGTVVCPDTNGSSPFSMAVDRQGTAYMLVNDGRLYKVSTRDARCEATPYVTGQQDFQTFGMGFATNALGPDETLFVAGNGRDGAAAGMAALSLAPAYGIAPLGMFSANVASAELTGTGDGRIFGFYTRDQQPGSFIGEIDKSNARVVAETALPMIDQGRAWAFAFWGGDFYMFVSPTTSSGSLVVRYRPGDSTVAPVSAWSSPIVGAGVSTCAPQ